MNAKIKKQIEIQKRFDTYNKSRQKEKDLRMYILVNEDIKVNKGKLAGQVGHAVASMFYHQYKTAGKLLPIMDEYMKTQKKIILYCSQGKLEKLEQEGHITIRDKGYTDLEPDTLTCVNIGLIDYSMEFPEEYEFIKNLNLVR